MKRCLVLMCTYNGEKYLREQLDSILAQEGISVDIKVADDCSTDSTVEILKEYSEKFPNITFAVNERNKRFAYNFIDLFFTTRDTDYDYYAFSDQDDVWFPEKIIRAVEKIESCKAQNENGIFYCSNLIVVDENLNPMGKMQGDSIFRASCYTFPFDNIATGCTIVMDRSFQRHALKNYPSGITLHDFWFFLIAAYTATYVYDDNAYISYRQHASNVIGCGKKPTVKYRLSPCVEELVKLYGSDISAKNQKILKTARGYKKNIFSKMKIIFSRKYYRTRFGIRFRIKILLGRG